MNIPPKALTLAFFPKIAFAIAGLLAALMHTPAALGAELSDAAFAIFKSQAQDTNLTVLDIVFEVPTDAVRTEEVEGTEVYRLGYSYNIFPLVDGEAVEDTNAVITNSYPGEFPVTNLNRETGKIFLTARASLEPGSYRIETILQDGFLEAGRHVFQPQDFTIRRFPEGRLSISDPIVVSDFRRVGNVSRFEDPNKEVLLKGNFFIIPDVAPSFTNNQKVQFYYRAVGLSDENPFKGSKQVTYQFVRLADNRPSPASPPIEVTSSEQIYPFDLEPWGHFFKPGSYRFVVKITDPTDDTNVATNSVDFEILENTE